MRRQCKETGHNFEVSAADLEFYRQISPTYGGKTLDVPPPTLCPEARMRRRLCFRNERTLYRRKCSLSGKDVVSNYSPDSPIPVADVDLWYSDSWDAADFGQEYDPQQPFFDQFAELMQKVPMYALSQRFGSENSPYTNLVSGNKNCHYIFAATANEDCHYSTYLQRCRDVADSFFIFDSELCYECIDCYHCYRTFASQECDHCTECRYLIGCVGCTDCFGCVSLAKQTYCIFNEQYSKEDYKQAVAALLSRSDCAQFIAERMRALLARWPRKYYAGIDIEDSTGDHLAHSRNAQSCFDCTYLEDCSYCTWLHRAKNCYDCYAWGLSGELGLENHLVGNNFYHVLFSDECSDDVSHLLYCRGCYSRCAHLFGCIGMKRSSYCILNRRYSKEEYEALVPQIVESMVRDGEWGEFFPQRIAPYCYNESVAAEYFPLTQSEVEQRGWRWRTKPLPGIYSTKTSSWSEVPTDPEALDESLADKIVACESSGRNFRFSKQEIRLYKKLGMPAPRRCFEERYKVRFAKRNGRVLYSRKCFGCGSELQSTYAPERIEQICCEDCFRRRLVGE